MITPTQIAELEAAVESWRDTPFCEGMPRKGVGVSCHHFVGCALIEAGLLPPMPIPNGPSNWSAGQPHSLIAAWIEESGLFAEIATGAAAATVARQPADVLGFHLGACVHHAAIALAVGRMAHSVRGHGVLIAASIPVPWEKRLRRVWRLKTLL